MCKYSHTRYTYTHLQTHSLNNVTTMSLFDTKTVKTLVSFVTLGSKFVLRMTAQTFIRHKYGINLIKIGGCFKAGFLKTSV